MESSCGLWIVGISWSDGFIWSRSTLFSSISITDVSKLVIWFSTGSCIPLAQTALPRPSQGRGGGGGVPVSLFPWNKLACSPVPQNSKICSLMFPVPHYCLCSPVPLKILPLFPCSPEINTLFPLFPKTPGRAPLLGPTYCTWIEMSKSAFICCGGAWHFKNYHFNQLIFQTVS